MPRKKAEKGTAKTNRQTFRLLPQEIEMFEAYADNQGTDRSKILIKVVRELITEQPHLMPEELKAFQNAARQVMGIGRNLNQLTRAVHEGKAPASLQNEAYYKAIIERLDDLKTALTYYVAHTKNRWVKEVGAGE